MWSEEAERRLRGGSPAVARTVADVFERYAELESPKKRTGVWEAKRLRFFARDPIAKTPLEIVGPRHFAAWRDERLKTACGETCIRDMTIMQTALGVAVKEWQWLTVNPLAGVNRPEGGEARYRRVTAEELARVCHVGGYVPGQPLESFSALTAAAFLLSCCTAMRAGEVVNLTRNNVHLDTTPWLHIPRGKTKAAKRDVPLILPGAVEVLRDVMALGEDPVFALTDGRRDALFRKIAKRAGIDDLHFHDACHEGISRYATVYKDVMRLAKVVGRTDLRVLLTVYYNPTIEELSRVE